METQVYGDWGGFRCVSGNAQSLRPILTVLPISFVGLVGWWLVSFSNLWYLVLFFNEAGFRCLAGAVCLASVPLSLGNAVPSAGPRSQDFWRSYLWWSKQDFLLSHPNWHICRMGSYSKNTSFIPGTNLRLKLSFFLHAFVILCVFVSFFILSAELFNSVFSLDSVLNLLLESGSSLLLNFPCLSLNFRAKTMILMSLVEARLSKWKTTSLSYFDSAMSGWKFCIRKDKSLERALFRVVHWCCLCKNLFANAVCESIHG